MMSDKKKEVEIRKKLEQIHHVMDKALGDTDVTCLTYEELREEVPFQWCASEIAQLIRSLDSGNK